MYPLSHQTHTHTSSHCSCQSQSKHYIIYSRALSTTNGACDMGSELFVRALSRDDF